MSRGETLVHELNQEDFLRWAATSGMHPTLTADEEHALIASAQAGDASARDELVEKNQRLVLMIARRWVGSGVPLMDLIQEGSIGLLSAIKGFDLGTGNRFSTYATWWITSYVRRAVDGSGAMIRTPVHVTQLQRKVHGIREQEPGVTDEQVIERAGCTAQQLSNIDNCGHVVGSIDAPISDDEEDALDHFASDATSEDDLIEAVDRRTAVDRALAVLDERERHVLVGLYERERTLKQLGTELSHRDGGSGVTRERVRQIKVKALDRMRRAARAAS